MLEVRRLRGRDELPLEVDLLRDRRGEQEQPVDPAHHPAQVGLVVETAEDRFGAQLGERRGLLRPAVQRVHLRPRRGEEPDDLPAHVAGGSGHEHGAGRSIRILIHTYDAAMGEQAGAAVTEADIEAMTTWTLIRLGRHLEHLLADALRPHGLTPQQYGSSRS